MATFNTAFGSLPGTADALGTNNNTANTAPRPPRNAQPANGTPTFAQLQASGQARPAPPQGGFASPVGSQAPENPTLNRLQQSLAGSQQAVATAAPAPRFTDTTGEGLRAGLLEQINSMFNQPVDPSFAAQGAVKRADLEEQAKRDQRSLQETLASRGLFASTIGADQMGELSGQQTRAIASLEADILRQQQEAATQNRLAGTTALTSLAQMTGDIELRAQQLQQQAALEGRALDLTQARDQASRELGLGQLQLGRDELAQQGQIENARLEETRALRLQNLGISGRELDLKALEIQNTAKFQGRTLDLQEARDLAEVDFRTKQLMQEDKRLTYEQARDLANRESEERMAKDRNDVTTRGQDIDKENARLDRDLRALLGNRQLDLDTSRLSIDQKTLLIRIAEVVGIDNLTADDLKALGLTPRTPPAPGGGAGGGGGGGNAGSQFTP